MNEDILTQLREAIPTAQNGFKELLKEAGKALKATTDQLQTTRQLLETTLARMEELEATLESQPLYEAPGSINLRMIDPETGAMPQFTFRFHSPKKATGAWPEIKQDLASLGLVSEERYHAVQRAEAPQDQPVSPPPASAGTPPPMASGQPQNGGELSFEAATLSGSMTEGKTYWKVKGPGQFHKFGVTIWDEVLVAAGFIVENLNPAQTYSLVGYTAHYELNESGKAKKVTRLEKR